MSSRESDHSLFGRHPGDAWGLYLDACLVDTEFPFEDGSPLVLPYALRANGVAVTVHGKKIGRPRPHAELHQIVVNFSMPGNASQSHTVFHACGAMSLSVVRGGRRAWDCGAVYCCPGSRCSGQW
jgi:hypothetical protein